MTRKEFMALTLEVVKTREWGRYLDRVDRCWRWAAFDCIAPYLDDAEYWSYLRLVWMDHESRSGVRHKLKRLFNPPGRTGRDGMMTDEERTRLAALPEKVTVYRGCQDGRRSWSWTLDRETARWFALRLYTAGHLLEGAVKRSKIIALFLGRDEEEVLCAPQDVRVFAKTELQP